MQNAPVTRRDSQLAHLKHIADQAKDYADQAKAPNTKRAYRADWQDFTAWCRDQRLDPLPAAPETVALYLTQLSDHRKVSTLQRRMAAISQAHQFAGHPSPTKESLVRTVMSGIRRAKGTAQERKAPTMTDDIRAMVEALPDNLTGIRDRALLLVGFAGAFRRSELVGLDVTDLQFTSQGLVITLRRSKTDQEGEGRTIGIPHGTNSLCPVKALQEWLTVSGIAEGAIFRPINRHGQIRSRRMTAQVVSLVVKKYAEATGLNPTQYAGHSLRAGLATSAAASGTPERVIQRQTGHRSLTILRRYIRDGDLFRENAAADVGL